MSSIFDYTTFFLMMYFYKCVLFSAPGTADAAKLHFEHLFHTGWFVESLLTQTLIVHIIRTNKIPFIESAASPSLILTTLAVMGIAIYLPFSPLGGYLGFVPLPASFWGWMAATLIGYSVLTHLMKTFFIRRYGAD
jgi:P-type Mg2+ transporter